MTLTIAARRLRASASESETATATAAATAATNATATGALVAVVLLALFAQAASAQATPAGTAAPAAAASAAQVAQAPQATQAAPAAPRSAASVAPANPRAPSIRPVDDAWRAGLPLEAKAATQAYLDRLSPEAVARSNAYHEGRHWLQLWNWLASLAVAACLLYTRPSTALRDWAITKLRWAPVRDALYGAAYMAATWLLTLPLSIYEGFVREHAYGMATQSLGAWSGEQLVALLVSMIVGALVVAGLYAVLRRVGAQWWLWGTVATMVFMALGVAIAPVFIEPLFNTYRPVPEGPLKTAVLTMARANGVPVDNVYVFDASRQTTRVSANVSGLFGTAAVRLNDNLLERSSEAEVHAVMAHEIGHYALNHIPKSLLQMGLVVMVGFLFSQWAMRRLLARHGARWRIGAVADTASLPLLAAVLGTFFFFATPVFNTISRAQETEADLWGLNLAREPHGEAEVLLKLTEYRKPEPGALEETLFYTHPSTRTRIYNAMRWREQMEVARPATTGPTAGATPARP